MSLRDLDVLCAGTTCVDMRNPEFDFINDIMGNGLVADSSRMREVLPEWLAYDPAKGISAMGGGTLNIAPLISLAGGKTGILTAMGNDKPGRLMKKIMHDTSVMPIIEAEGEYASSVTFVKREEGGPRAALLHCPNAMDYFDANSCFQSAIGSSLKPGTIVHYAYSGLSRAMDENCSRRLASLMEYCRDSGYLTMADTHTYSANPKEDIAAKKVIPQYKLLETVLQHLDFFFCSQDEAMMIANSLGYVLGSYGDEQKKTEFLEMIHEQLMGDGTPRIVGITAGTSVTLMYLNEEGDAVVNEVSSPYIIADASNFVGAGDSFRAGFMLEWIKNPGYMMRFAKGNLKQVDLENLALMGHLMAACYVTRDEAKPYGNIPLYENMQDVVNSGREFTDKAELMKELHVLK